MCFCLSLEGSDFTSLINKEIIICDPGEANRECIVPVPINITEDHRLEGDESLTVRMSSGDVSLLSLSDSATIVIMNDDCKFLL